MEFIPLIACLAIGAALTVGAYTDWKSRVIPNAVPVTIMFCGIFTAVPWWFKFASLAFIVGFLALTRKKKSGGGDIKLYCALAFALGLVAMAYVLAGTLVLNFLFNLFVKRKKVDKTERIPLCSFVAPAYVIVMLVFNLLL